MSPADIKAVNDIAADIREMSDTDLHELAAENACLPGVNAAAVRREVDKELEYRAAYRHACDLIAWDELLAAMAPDTRWTATTGGTR